MGSENPNDLPQLWTAISHEIRTPLNVMKGMTDISENEIYDIELMRECLNKIKASTERMQDVVNALVDYASITQRNVEIQHEKLDFKVMITEIAMRSYLLAKQNKCHFNMHIKDVTEETLLGDESRISKVLLALLNVVVRYTASDGIIDFTVYQTGVSNSKVFMRFCLKSTALEFPEDIVSYLNDNSLYMNPDLLAPVGAFGITEMTALYFSYLMGGKITAANHPGDFSEIIFDMEFGRTEQPFSADGQKLFANQRILIAAVNKEICEERGKMLVDMGMEYDWAIEPDDVMEKIGEAEDQGKPFTICIFDWEMPDQSCAQLIKDIREIFGKDPLIIVTAHAPEDRLSEVQHLGANYCIDRTIFRSTLFDVLIGIEKGIQIQRENQKIEDYNFSGNRVLVAEDVALNMEVITKLLSRVNIEVTCVENGQEAVTQFIQKPAGFFDIIFLDINMPVMDGYDAAVSIRNSDKADAKTVPIYAMTANAFKEDVEKALSKGMNGHMAKPVDVNALYQILSQLLNKKAESEMAKLRSLAEEDPLTGCLNRRGFENRVEKLTAHRTPVAYAVIDVDDFKQINDRFGHDVGDEILKKIVSIMKSKFTSADYIVRLGGDEFAVILVNYRRQAAFLQHRMEEVNEELLHPDDGMPAVTVSVGAVIASSGYSQDLYTSADKALYQAKHNGKSNCVIFNDEVDEIEKDAEDNAVYAENLHYVNDRQIVIVNRYEQIRSSLMIRNKPVGFATGFCDPSCSIYSYSGFFPELLGYTKNEFKETAVNGFGLIVHPDDRNHLMNKGEEDTIRDEKIRLIGKNGDYLWFNMNYLITKTSDGRDFWMASFKNIDDQLVGSFCESDYRMVATIDPEQGSIMIEKGAYLVSDRKIHIQNKYNYRLLVENAVAGTVMKEERARYLLSAALGNVIRKLDVDGVYEFTVRQQWGKESANVIRHKYRFISGKKDMILVTWEFMGKND